MRSPRLLAALAVLATAVLSLAMLAGLTSPAPAAVSDPTTAPAVERNPSNDYESLPKACASRADQIPQTPVLCHLNRFHKDRPTVVLWGDSHAWMFTPALRRAAAGHRVNLVASLLGSCPPMDNNWDGVTDAPNCVKSNDMGLKYVLRLAKGRENVRVILGGSWQRYLSAARSRHPERFGYVGFVSAYFKGGTPRLFRTLGRAGVATDVIGQVATVPEERTRCIAGNDPYSCDLPRSESLPQASITRHWLARAMQPLPGDDRQISVDSELCDETVCHGIVDGDHTWFDDFHLSATTSRKLAGYLVPTVQRVDSAFPMPSCPIPLLC